MSLEIRNANLKDAAEIAKIHVETWQDAYRGQIPDNYLNNLSVLDRTKKWQERLGDQNDTNIYLVGTINGKIAGWASLCKCRDDDAPKSWGEIGGIYIHPSAQGKGVGSSLMREGLKRLKENGYLKATLWVLTTNTSARQFYESKGWKAEGKTKIDSRDGFELHETRYSIDLAEKAHPKGASVKMRI